MPDSTSSPRHLEIDAVRGFAVLGILLMNITGMGLPSGAYINPSYAGGDSGADLTAWIAAFLLVDGKMRALFTLLFGASLLLIADGREGQVPGPAATHYRRTFWLFVIGMIHAWLIWFGDILVTYALAGSLAFLLRKRSPRQLMATGAVVLALLAAYDVSSHFYLESLRAQATTPGADAAVVAQWREIAADLIPDPATATREIALYRGGFSDAFEARKPMTLFFQTFLIPTVFFWEALGTMLIGMGLFRSGFFTGGWSDRSYRGMLCLLPLGTLLTLPVAHILLQARWDGVLTIATDAAGLPLHLGMALGYAAGIVLLTRAAFAARLVERLAACGRMALTNYLGASILTTTLFYGYGFGRFAHYGRAELYSAVLAIWFIQMFASPLWLARFRYGPAEWLWRSLVRMEAQPLRR